MSSPVKWTSKQRRHRMAHRHGLLQQSGSHPETANSATKDLASSLIGLHSSDPATVYLSVATRNPLATVDSIQHELDQLVRHHAMRRTLWVFDQRTAPTAHAACTRKIAGAERNKLLKALASTTAPNAPSDPERWLLQASEAVQTELTEGRLSTRQLGQRLPDFRVMLEMAPGTSYSTSQSALSRVLLLLGFDGQITRKGPVGRGWINSQYTWELADGIAVSSVDEAEAQRELARRWLYTFGPATETDLRWWMGWTARDARRALAAVGAVDVLLDDGETGWCLSDHCEPEPPGQSWTAVLPGLDPTIMGWKQRDWFLDPALVSTVFDRNGNAGPTLWVDGQVVGGWVQTADGSLNYRLLTDVGREQRSVLEQQLDRLSTFIGETRFKVRFPAPLQKDLYSNG